MDGQPIVFGLAIALGFASAALVAPSVLSWFKRVVDGIMVRRRMSSETSGQRGRATIKAAAISVLEGGFPPLSKLASLAAKVPLVGSKSRSLSQSLGMLGIRCCAQTVCEFSIVATCVAFVAGFAVTGSPVVAALVCLAIALICDSLVKKSVAKSKQRMIEQLPDAFRALGIYYGAGLTLKQSMQQVATEIDGTLGKAFEGVDALIETGVSSSDALGTLRDFDCDQLEYLAVILEIQQRTGGSLQPLLERAADSVSKSQAMQRALEVKTSSSRLSAKIITSMPIAILILIGIADPSCITAFFASSVGVAMFCTACAMQVLGVISIKRILDVDVR